MDKNISEYITKQKLPQKEVLMKMREFIKILIPDAEERMSYGVPSFKWNGKNVLYAAFKNHIGFYPGPEIIEFFGDKLTKYATSKGTIKFLIKDEIPFDLIKDIINYKFR